VKLKMIAHEHILEKSCSDMQYTGSEGDGFLASQLNERTIQGLSRAPKHQEVMHKPYCVYLRVKSPAASSLSF
jgi:hypothetical protein